MNQQKTQEYSNPPQEETHMRPFLCLKLEQVLPLVDCRPTSDLIVWVANKHLRSRSYSFE